MVLEGELENACPHRIFEIDRVDIISRRSRQTGTGLCRDRRFDAFESIPEAVAIERVRIDH